MDMKSRSVCVYCASSNGVHTEYVDVAKRLGLLLAANGYGLIYGGSRMGAMGAVADGALSKGGYVIGVMPDFLQRLELAHQFLSEFHVVEDMRARKHQMLAGSRAVIALAGGCGTFEELLEAVTLKKLGVHRHPIIIVNTRNYYAPLLAQFEAAASEGFLVLKERLWDVVQTPEEAVDFLATALP
jgi:uncharacterized protein (TIGR00730 family)